MTTHHLKVLSTSMAALCAVALAPAQTAPLPPVTSNTAESPARPAPPRRTRAISPEVAAQLSASTPKFTPAPPKPAPKPEEELPDMREIDKPKNKIIRLPKYVVREPKPPVLSETAVSTQKGLADIAMRRYISEADRALNRFTLPLFGTSMQQRAVAMYHEDERLNNMAALSDDVRMINATDQAAGTYVKREADKTFMRTSDFGWQGGNPQ